MIVKGISIRRVANGGIIVPLHEATFVDEDSIGVGLISDQYGLESVVLKYSMERPLANSIRYLNGIAQFLFSHVKGSIHCFSILLHINYDTAYSL